MRRVPSWLRATSILSIVVRGPCRRMPAPVRLVEASEVDLRPLGHSLAGIVENGGVEVLCVPPVLGGDGDRVLVDKPVGAVPAEVMAAEIRHQEVRHRLAGVSLRRGRPHPEIEHPIAGQDRQILLCDPVEPAEGIRSGILLAEVVNRRAEQAAMTGVAVGVARIDGSRGEAVEVIRIGPDAWHSGEEADARQARLV